MVYREPFRHFRFNNCWTNGIHPLPFGSKLERYRSRKTDDRELAGSVNRCSWNDCSQTGDRSVVHNRTASGLKNSRDLMFQAEQYAADVGVHAALEKFIRVSDSVP